MAESTGPVLTAMWRALKIGGYVTAFYGGIMFTMIAIGLIPFLRDEIHPAVPATLIWGAFSSESAAAWVQAIGTIVALGVAIYAPMYHHRIAFSAAEKVRMRPLRVFAKGLDEALARFAAQLQFSSVGDADSFYEPEEELEQIYKCARQCIAELDVAADKSGEFDDETCDRIIVTRDRVEAFLTHVMRLRSTCTDTMEDRKVELIGRSYAQRRDVVVMDVSHLRTMLEALLPRGYVRFTNPLDIPSD